MSNAVVNDEIPEQTEICAVEHRTEKRGLDVLAHEEGAEPVRPVCGGSEFGDCRKFRR